MEVPCDIAHINDIPCWDLLLLVIEPNSNRPNLGHRCLITCRNFQGDSIDTKPSKRGLGRKCHRFCEVISISCQCEEIIWTAMRGAQLCGSKGLLVSEMFEITISFPQQGRLMTNIRQPIVDSGAGARFPATLPISMIFHVGTCISFKRPLQQ